MTPAAGTNYGTQQKTVVGTFTSGSDAESALNGLKDANFRPEQVSVLARDNQTTRDVVDRTGMGADTEKGAHAGAGAGTGAVIGGIAGGVLGWLVGIGALFIPGIGPVIAAGALATTLGGAAIGAAAGGLIGALAGLGLPESDAQSYEEQVRQGRILLTVSAMNNDEAERVRSIFDKHNGTQVRVYDRGQMPASAGYTSDTTSAPPA